MQTKAEFLNEELELLGTLIRAERNTPCDDNAQCTEHQLEIVFKIVDEMRDVTAKHRAVENAKRVSKEIFDVLGDLSASTDEEGQTLLAIQM